MPIEAAMQEVEKVNLQDDVSDKDIKDLQAFEDVIKKLEFSKEEVKESLAKAETQIRDLLQKLEKVDVEKLSEQNRLVVERITGGIGFLLSEGVYDEKTPDPVNDNTDNPDQEPTAEKADQEPTNQEVQARKDEVEELVESAEDKMVSDVLKSPTETKKLHNVFHVNEGAFTKFLTMVRDRDENPEQYAKVQKVFAEYAKAMNVSLPTYDHLAVGTVEENGVKKEGLIAVENPAAEKPFAVTFGVDAKNPNNPQWLKELLGQGTPAQTLNQLKGLADAKGMKFSDGMKGLKGLMEKLSYLGGLIASSLDEFGLFDLPDWVKEKAKSFKEEMIQEQIIPENKDKYTTLSGLGGLKEYFMETYKTPDAKNAVLSQDSGFLQSLKDSYFQSVKTSEIKNESMRTIYKEMAKDNNFVDAEDMVLKTTKQERVTLFQKYKLKAEQLKTQTTTSEPTKEGTETSVDQAVKVDVTDGTTQTIESLKINGLDGKVTLATSTQGQYLEINGMPVALNKDGNGFYMSTNSAGNETLMFTVNFDKNTNGLTVQPLQVLKPLNGPIDTQDAITKSAHLSKMLMSSEFNPSTLTLNAEGETLSSDDKKSYTETLLAVQKDVQDAKASKDFAMMKDKYTSEKLEVNLLQARIDTLKTNGPKSMIPIYTKLQDTIKGFFTSPVDANKKDKNADTKTDTKVDETDKKNTPDQGSPEDMKVEQKNSYGDGE